MKLLHEKSKCCGARIIRFGGKRRQCAFCKKTWRVHPAKQGRKPLRKQCHYLKKVFNHGFKVNQLALNSTLSVDTVYKRFASSLDAVVSQKRVVRIRGDKLILVIDAEWQYFKSELWTLYFLALKAVGTEKVIILDPILRRGKENAIIWNNVIDQIPISVKKRIIAIVSDGIRGIENIAESDGWTLQRCHFHILSRLQKMRGKRASTYGRLVREEIYNSVKLALTDTSARRLNILCRRLAVLAQEDGCPKAMRMIVKEFLRHLPDFRSYLDHPELQLPTTVNVMESINSFVRRKSMTTNTPKSWHKWATACVRLKSKFICK